MDISVPSRFACLKIEDDDFRPVSSKSKKRTIETKQAKKPAVQTQNAGKKSPKAGCSSTKLKKTGKNSKQENQQWEDWKKKDDEIVNDHFEQDLQCALLQSKLDFEKQKKNAVIKTDDGNQSKKKKGKTTMSLEQFLDNKPQNNGQKADDDKVDDEGNFFEKMAESTKQEVNKEQVEENRKRRQKDMEEVITISQYQDKLDQEKMKNRQLQKELEEAKKEIALVKKRNTTLCKLLSQGEMKDKAEVLVELERVSSEKEELTEEVSRLHKLLEKERSNKSNGYTENTKHAKDKISNKKKKH